MALINDLKRKFALASPKQKRIWILTGGGLAFLLVLWPLTALKPPPPRKLSDRLESRVVAPPRRNIDLDSIAATQTNIQRQINELTSRMNMGENERKDMAQRFSGQLQDVAAGKIGGDSFSKELDERVTRRIEKMKAEGQLGLPGGVQSGTAQLGAPLPAVPDTTLGPIQPRDPNEPGSDGAGGSRRGKLRQIVAEETSTADDARAQSPGATASAQDAVALANPTYPGPGRVNVNSTSRDRNPFGEGGTGGQTWLPAGAILTGVLITGMDAPASPAAQKQPTPALVRLKFDATLPNHFRVDIKECFALVDGYGQLSSERALLRSQRLTCVRQDGGVVETNLDGYVVGEDGKVGMRGRPVTKEGALIARTLTAGMLSGVGHRLAGNSSSGGISIGGGSGGGLAIGGGFEQAAGAGIGTSFNKVADFYLELAKEMVPVIEIDAGRQVTIILVHGVSIKNTKS